MVAVIGGVYHRACKQLRSRLFEFSDTTRFKTENRSLFLDAETIEELIAVVRERVRYYNWERRHSSLGNQAPRRYAKSLIEKKSSQ